MLLKGIQMSASNKILIEDYNPEWAQWFENLKSQIWPLVKEEAVSMEHVGSTAVPGLVAKPVIDIDIVIENAKKLPAVVKNLQSLGYKHRGNMGIEGREAFRSPTHQIKHHLYVCAKDCIALKNHLLLRGHLVKNPQARDEYGVLKRHLAKTCESMDDYVQRKTAFIIGVLAHYGLDPKELNAIEMSNRSSNRRLLIKSASQRAELWEGDHLFKTYRISTAMNGLGCQENSYCTPTGKLRVASKIGEGLPMGSVLRARIPTGEVWTADPSNPLFKSTEDLVLTRLLWLEGTEDHNANTFRRFIYLHGTNQETLLGQPASHGCIRFSNAEILEIFELLQAGNEVEVLSE
jgi:GrpB-like predicted nucleotidyltransferase (UPF0157 family)